MGSLVISAVVYLGVAIALLAALGPLMRESGQTLSLIHISEPTRPY